VEVPILQNKLWGLPPNTELLWKLMVAQLLFMEPEVSLTCS
jgi:hypothetical protein